MDTALFKLHETLRTKFITRTLHFLWWGISTELILNMQHQNSTNTLPAILGAKESWTMATLCLKTEENIIDLEGGQTNRWPLFKMLWMMQNGRCFGSALMTTCSQKWLWDLLEYFILSKKLPLECFSRICGWIKPSAMLWNLAPLPTTWDLFLEMEKYTRLHNRLQWRRQSSALGGN